jgi:hypothetical protein
MLLKQLAGILIVHRSQLVWACTLQGYLLPYFHTSYWIGLALDLWPSFRWTDPSMPLVTPPYYNNWGNYTGEIAHALFAGTSAKLRLTRS